MNGSALNGRASSGAAAPLRNVLQFESLGVVPANIEGLVEGVGFRDAENFQNFGDKFASVC